MMSTAHYYMNSSFIFLLFVSEFIITTLSDQYLTEECERVRRPIDQLSVDELMLYVEGMQAIRANGKYQVLIDAHKEHTEIHRGSSFFFYHTYYVWEVETQIRDLGGKYKCFSLPYYDWTIDAGNEHHPFILNTVFGGDGDPNHHNCVTNPNGGGISTNWGPDKWPIKELCNPDENVDIGCCLKRNLWSDSELGNAHEIGSIVQRPTFEKFEGGIAFHHQKVHWLFGLGDECASCAMATGYSPDDPIFMLLHSFTAYLRAVWASCHGYAVLSGEELDDHSEAYDPRCAEGYPDCGVIELDDIYQFGDMVNQKWSITSTMEVTPRKMWDFNDWNIRFDRGTFIDRAGLETSGECDIDSLRNSKWLLPPKKKKNEFESSSNYDRLQILDRVSAPDDALSKMVYNDEVGILEEIEQEHSSALLERLEREQSLRRQEVMNMEDVIESKVMSKSTNFLNELNEMAMEHYDGMEWEGRDVVDLLKEEAHLRTHDGEEFDIPILERREPISFDQMDVDEQSHSDDVLENVLPIQMEEEQKEIESEGKEMEDIIAERRESGIPQEMELLNVNINASLQRAPPTHWQKYGDTYRAFAAAFIIFYWSFRFYQFIRSRGCDVKESLLRATERAYGSV